MYKELFQTEQSLTKILIATYGEIIEVNRLLVIYFQQRRKTAPSLDLYSMLIVTSLGGTFRFNMEAA
jgi:hypothetical protein